MNIGAMENINMRIGSANVHMLKQCLPVWIGSASIHMCVVCMLVLTHASSNEEYILIY